jgi:hypothetical protein
VNLSFEASEINSRACLDLLYMSVMVKVAVSVAQLCSVAVN